MSLFSAAYKIMVIIDILKRIPYINETTVGGGIFIIIDQMFYIYEILRNKGEASIDIIKTIVIRKGVYPLVSY
jgi:hypothetical protein